MSTAIVAWQGSAALAPRSSVDRKIRRSKYQTAEASSFWSHEYLQKRAGLHPCLLHVIPVR